MAKVFWTPATDPATLVLAQPPATPDLDQSVMIVEDVHKRPAPEGLYVRFAIGGQDFSSICPDGQFPQGPVGVIILTDSLIRDRLDALERFHNAVRCRRPLADPRLTPLRRRNLRQMLQAVDGRLAGATYLDIAEAVLGAERVTSIAWKSMPLRDTIMRRVREGMELVGGGYRHLLRRRRPD